MKKTIFKGVVNGVNYSCVEDYNKAVTAALKEGKDVDAHSSTQITEVPDEECKCCCEKKAEAAPLDFNFKGMMAQDVDKLDETLCSFKKSFDELPDDEFKKGMMKMIRDTKVIADRQIQSVGKDIDMMDAQIAEATGIIDDIEAKINELEKQIDAYDDQIAKLSESADNAQENYDKLSMVSDALDEIIQENHPTEPKKEVPMTINDLWKSLFGAAEKMLKN